MLTPGRFGNHTGEPDNMNLPSALPVDAFASFTVAILLLFVGRALIQTWKPLRRFSIPESVVGGLLCVLVVGWLDLVFNIRVSFDLGVRDQLLLYFFAAVGLNSDVRDLARGGRPLVILLALASCFIVVQNLTGMTMAGLFGLDPRAGLMVGSISLTGGVGTTLAWAPYFSESLGITNAYELGMAGNMIGLIAACCIGGPIAVFLMRRYDVAPSGDTQVGVGAVRDEETSTRLNYYGVLLALFWLNIALMLGEAISELIKEAGLNLPTFVGCLIAGILLRNVMPRVTKRRRRLWNWNSMRHGVALISDVCLGMFLIMALMSLKLWELHGSLGFLAATLSLQVLIAAAFIVFVLFRCLGRDYEAVVTSAGFGGISLGSTATAIANMSAVAREHGAAPRAFIVVPLVCGFFIDLVNALVIGFMAG